jgi:hypothetical protein
MANCKKAETMERFGHTVVNKGKVKTTNSTVNPSIIARKSGDWGTP